MRNLARALFTHERIITTVEKAKEARRFVEKLITLARTKRLHARRLALARLPDREIVAKLFDEIAPRFKDRAGWLHSDHQAARAAPRRRRPHGFLGTSQRRRREGSIPQRTSSPGGLKVSDQELPPTTEDTANPVNEGTPQPPDENPATT